MPDDPPSEILDKTLTGPNRERPDEPLAFELLGRTENRFRVLHELTGHLAELEGKGFGTSAKTPVNGRSSSR